MTDFYVMMATSAFNELSKPCVSHLTQSLNDTLQLYGGEWASGLRGCSKNRKVSSSNSTRRSGTQPRYEAPGDLWVENVKCSD